MSRREHPGETPPAGACPKGGGECGGRRTLPVDPDAPPAETCAALLACQGVLELYALWQNDRACRGNLGDAITLCGIDELHPKAAEALRLLPTLLGDRPRSPAP